MTNKGLVWYLKKEKKIDDRQFSLTFSSKKPVSIIFRKRNKEPMEIMLRNEKIPSTENIHFLRLTLYSRLNCEEYVKKLTFIAQRALNTIKVVAG